jgi:hypothetical protein
VTFTRSLFFLVVALLCFAIGLLLAINVISGGNQDAWLFGGLLSFTAAHLFP